MCIHATETKFEMTGPHAGKSKSKDKKVLAVWWRCGFNGGRGLSLKCAADPLLFLWKMKSSTQFMSVSTEEARGPVKAKDSNTSHHTRVAAPYRFRHHPLVDAPLAWQERHQRIIAALQPHERTTHVEVDRH